MAGVLESLAAGLRQAGGVLSAPVQGILANEASQDEAYKQRIAQAIMQNQMAQNSPEARMKLAQLKNEEGYRAALSQLPQDAPPEAQAALAMKFGKPEIAATFIRAREDREARVQAGALAMEQKRAELAAKLQTAQENRASREDIARMMIDGRREMAQLAASLRTGPAPTPPQLITNENGVFVVDKSGATATPVIGPDGKPLAGKSATEKAMPASAAKGLLENRQNTRRAEQALLLMEGKSVGAMTGDASATGLKGFLPDAVLQRMDPQGVDARAAIGDLGSLVIHDRSGAAVTAAEFPRLQPFIPSPKDDPETAKKKLRRFVQVYKEVTTDTEEFYRGGGYKVPPTAIPPAGGTPAGASDKFTVGKTYTDASGKKAKYLGEGKWEDVK